MLDINPTLHNSGPHLASLAQGIRAFRSAQPNLDLPHLDLLLLVSQKPGRDTVEYAKLLGQPLLEVGFCLRDLTSSGSDLIRFALSSGGRAADVQLTQKGLDLVQSLAPTEEI